MQDRNVSVSVSVARMSAWGAWVSVVALLGLGVVVDDTRPMHCGLAMSAAAATLTIRCYCIKLGRNIRTAFELGRIEGNERVSRLDSVRSRD